MLWRGVALAMNACRRCLVALAGIGVALIVRDDRAANGAGLRGVRGVLREVGGGFAPTPEEVQAVLASAGARGVSLALELLGAPAPAVRAGAAGYLGGRRSRLAVPCLIRLLRDPEPMVRCAAAKALGEAGDPQAVPFLERAMCEGEPVLAEVALAAVREIRRASSEASRAGRRQLW